MSCVTRFFFKLRHGQSFWYVKFFCWTYHFLDLRYEDIVMRCNEYDSAKKHDCSYWVLIWLVPNKYEISNQSCTWGHLSSAMPVNKQFVPVILDIVPQELHLNRWEREMMCLEWCTWELFDICKKYAISIYAVRIGRYLDDVDLCVFISMFCAVLFNCDWTYALLCKQIGRYCTHSDLLPLYIPN